MKQEFIADTTFPWCGSRMSLSGGGDTKRKALNGLKKKLEQKGKSGEFTVRLTTFTDSKNSGSETLMLTL